jgi:hypothetical protein
MLGVMAFGSSRELDGHTGLSNQIMKEGTSGTFELALSYLKVQKEGGFFVVHATSRAFDVSGYLPRGQFLRFIGFKEAAQCQKFGDCHYKITHESSGFGDTSPAYNSFEFLVGNLENLYNQTRSIYQAFGQDINLFPWAEPYGGTIPKLDLSGEPSWLAEERPQEHLRVIRELAQLERIDRKYKEIEYVLWGTGEQLENALVLLLGEMGCEGRRTQKGATVDILATVPDTEIRFGIEVTGTNEAIKKSSNKFQQAVQFIQEREDEREKVLIVANAHNATPRKERPEAFTPEIASLLSKMGITGITTEAIYHQWLEGDVEAHREFFRRLYEHQGGVFR